MLSRLLLKVPLRWRWSKATWLDTSPKAETHLVLSVAGFTVMLTAFILVSNTPDNSAAIALMIAAWVAMGIGLWHLVALLHKWGEYRSKNPVVGKPKSGIEAEAGLYMVNFITANPSSL